MKRRPLSERQHQLLAMPTIESQLPVVFNNGVRWTHCTFECVNCKRDLPDSDVHGELSRNFPKVAILEAVGWCEPCRLVTAYNWRLHDDLRLTGKRDGRWVTWRMKPSLWGRFTRFLSLHFLPNHWN